MLPSLFDRRNCSLHIISEDCYLAEIALENTDEIFVISLTAHIEDTLASSSFEAHSGATENSISQNIVT